VAACLEFIGTDTGNFFSIEVEKFVFVAVDEFGQGRPESVAEARASKPVFWMSNDPFRQGVSQQVALADSFPLII
jgi:hypothetical protein